MLISLTNALACLVALESRVVDLVEPDKAIAEGVKAVVKELAIVLPQIIERIEAIEKDLATVKEHPALSVPALDTSAPGAEPKVGDHVHIVADTETAAP